MTRHDRLAKTLTLAATAFLLVAPGVAAISADAAGSEGLTMEAVSGSVAKDDGNPCHPTTWVQITEPFPTITIREDCLPIIGG